MVEEHSLIEKITRWMETVLGLVLIASVSLNCVNIAARHFFNATLISADELQIFGMITITFLGVFVVSWRQKHLRMDVLSQALPGWLRAILKLLEQLIICVLCGLIIVVSWEYVSRMFALGVRSENAEIPMWIPHAIITAGMALAVLVAFAQLIQSLGRRAGNKQSASKEAP